VVKIGITDCLGSRDCAYATGEFIRETFSLVYKVTNSRLVERDIYIKFNKFKAQNTGGTEFYSDKIIEDATFNTYMSQFIKLTNEEINQLINTYKIRQRHAKLKQIKKCILIRKLIRNKLNVKKERDYQTTNINYCYDSIMNHGRIYLKQPTGTGKTFVGYNIIKKLHTKIVIIFSPRQIVNSQNAACSILGHTIFNYSKDNNLSAFLDKNEYVVIVACIQSAKSVYEEIGEYTNITVWFDEAHWSLESWVKDDKNFWLLSENIKYRLFTSASPNEEIVKKNSHIFGELYCPMTIRDFIESKWLAPITPFIYSEDNKNVNKIKYLLEDFKEKKRSFGFSFHNNCIHAYSLFKKHVKEYNEHLTDIKPFLLVSEKFNRAELEYAYTDIKTFETHTNSIGYVVAQYSMGYDFSRLDFIYFGDPKFAFKDIIQSIGRGFRPDGLGKDGTNLLKNLIVSLPVFIVNEETDYENIIKVLYYLLNDVNLSFDEIIFKRGIGLDKKSVTEEDDTGDDLIKSKLFELLKERKTRRYLSYKEAREFNIENHIFTPNQYREMCKKDSRLCEDADQYYKGFDWFYFLGKSVNDRSDCYSLDECKKKVTEYIKLYPHFKDYHAKLNELTNELYKLDRRFPPKDLWVYYYDTGLDKIIQFPSKKTKGIFR
jgi:hypothetical protein